MRGRFVKTLAKAGSPILCVNLSGSKSRISMKNTWRSTKGFTLKGRQAVLDRPLGKHGSVNSAPFTAGLKSVATAIEGLCCDNTIVVLIQSFKVFKKLEEESNSRFFLAAAFWAFKQIALKISHFEWPVPRHSRERERERGGSLGKQPLASSLQWLRTI